MSIAECERNTAALARQGTGVPLLGWSINHAAPSARRSMAHLVEILLPLKDASGEDFPAACYDDLAKELVANNAIR